MCFHLQPPECSWLPGLCAQRPSLLGTPCPMLSDCRSSGTTVASTTAQAHQDYNNGENQQGRKQIIARVGTYFAIPNYVHYILHHHSPERPHGLYQHFKVSTPRKFVTTYIGLLLIRKSLKSPCGMSSSTTIVYM